jgi:hypothetical protein
METGEDKMKHRVLGCCGVVLGVIVLTSSFAVPMVSAQGNGAGPTATIAVTCRSTGDLFVDYSYSGFSGAVRGVDFHVDKVGDIVVTVKGGTGEVIQAFNQTAVGTPINWGTVGAELVSHTGKIVGGSTTGWASGKAVTC